MKKPLPPRESLQVVIQKLKAMSLGSAIPAKKDKSDQATEVTPELLKQGLNEAIVASSIGTMLREARRKRGLTGTQLATRLGMSKMRISQLEHSDANVEVATLARVAQALGYELRVELVTAGTERIEASFG